MTSHHSIDDIRADIAQTKSHIASTLDEIDHRRQGLKDWRMMVRNYPWFSVGLAVAAGFLMSGNLNLRQTLKPPQPMLNQMLWSTLSALALRKTAEVGRSPRLHFP